MDKQIEAYFDGIIANYETLLKLSLEERQCLVSINIDKLLNLLKEKEACLNTIVSNLDKIKTMDIPKTYIAKFKSKILDLASKLIHENSINAKIAQQHLAFSNSMLNLYLSFLNINQTYNSKANIPYKLEFNRIG